MAITYGSVANGEFDAVDHFHTGNITLDADKVYFCVISKVVNSTYESSGTGWTFLHYENNATLQAQLSILYRVGGGAADYQINLGETVSNYGCWAIVSAIATDYTGTPVVSANHAGASGGSASAVVTLGNFGDAVNNGLLFVVADISGATTVTPDDVGPDWTTLTGHSYGRRLSIYGNVQEDLTPSATLSTSRQWIAIAVEIKAPASGAGVGVSGIKAGIGRGIRLGISNR